MPNDRTALTPEQRALADGLARNVVDASAQVNASRAMLKAAEAAQRAANVGLAAFCAVIANDFTGRATYDDKRGEVVVRETPPRGTT
jgi:hypothetical protein